MQTLKEDGHKVVDECGMPMPLPAMGQSMPQQDSVSMNVSMNAQGKNGIRDLMNVLKDIEDKVTSEPAHIQHPEDDLVGKEVEIDGPSNPVELDHGDHEEHGEHDVAIIDGEAGSQGAEEPAISAKEKIAGAIAAGAVDEEFANRPNVSHKDINYMTKDLSGGLGTQQKMHKGGYRFGDNPLAFEGTLEQRLAALYQEIKEAYNPNSSAAQHRRMLDKSTHDRLKAAAEKDGASEADKARYKRYQDKKEAMRAEYNARMER